jgi:hypothetical protein
MNTEATRNSSRRSPIALIAFLVLALASGTALAAGGHGGGGGGGFGGGHMGGGFGGGHFGGAPGDSTGTSAAATSAITGSMAARSWSRTRTTSPTASTATTARTDTTSRTISTAIRTRPTTTRRTASRSEDLQHLAEYLGVEGFAEDKTHKGVSARTPTEGALLALLSERRVAFSLCTLPAPSAYKRDPLDHARLTDDLAHVALVERVQVELALRRDTEL